MSHDAVWALHQDRSGLIWVGTQDGLLRFDGERFDVIRQDLEFVSSLSNNWVSALYDDGEGGLWVGTFRGWLNRLDLVSGAIQRIAPPPELSSTQREAGSAIYEIVALGGRRLALATEIGAFTYDRDTGAYAALEPHIGSLAATSLLIDPNGDLLIGYSDGRLRVVRGTDDAQATPGITVAELGAEISAIRRDFAGGLWVATRGRGVFSLEEDGRARARLHASAEPDGRLLNDRVQDIWIDGNGEVWVATSNGLSVFAPGAPPAHFGENDLDSGSLPDRACQVVLQDAQGIVWIGTLGGLARVHPYNRAFRAIPARSPVEPNGIAGGGALAIAAAGASGLWIGTYGGGLDRLDLESGGFDHHAADPLGRSGPLNGEVKSLAVSPDGRLWMATMGGGIGRLDPPTGRFEPIPIEASTASVDASRVTAILVDRAGAVWASTQFDGLHRYNATGNVFRRYRGPEGTWDFGGDYAWPIIEDRERNLWLGVLSGGLVRISRGRLAAQLYNSSNSALPSALILTLHEGPDGHIWIGTEGAGLIRFDPESETFTSYTTRDGLPHDNVEGILSDRLGNLWISTNDGLARMDPQGEITTFSPNAGLHGRRFYANSAMALPDGRLAFGGEQGITLVTPERLQLLDEPSPVVLTGFTVGGEARPISASERESRVELGPSENFFTFRFTALDYADPEAVEYRYRLDPLDETWVENGNSRVANYTSVPPDEYVFRVSARNSFGVWNEDALTLDLVVHPPFYATLWFRSLVLAAIASLLTAAYVYRMQQLTRVHDVRFKIAGRLHDDIGADLGAILLKSESIRSAPALDDSVRRDLADIGRVAREAAEALQETVWMISAKYDTVARLLTKLRDATDTLLNGAVSYSVTVPPNPPDHPIEMEARQSAYLLYKEALHNVVKHAHAKHVNIVIAYEGSRLSISIEDDGRGFDPEKDDTGNGLGLMRERAARYDGSFRVASVPGRGTIVSFTLRLR